MDQFKLIRVATETGFKPRKMIGALIVQEFYESIFKIEKEMSDQKHKSGLISVIIENTQEPVPRTMYHLTNRIKVDGQIQEEYIAKNILLADVLQAQIASLNLESILNYIPNGVFPEGAVQAVLQDPQKLVNDFILDIPKGLEDLKKKEGKHIFFVIQKKRNSVGAYVPALYYMGKDLSSGKSTLIKKIKPADFVDEFFPQEEKEAHKAIAEKKNVNLL